MNRNGDTLPVAAVVGLGLMGGSLAMAMKAAGMTVYGIDRDEAVLEQARQRGAIDAALADADAAKVQLLVLALAPRVAVAALREWAPKLCRGTIVTDLCGVKRFVVKECAPICEAYGLHFIGGHPMAGKEKNGFQNAEASLFQGASYIVTPDDQTPEAVTQIMRHVVEAIGCAHLTVTTPEEHDRMIAFTSQLPHVLAGCYVQSPCSARHKGYSAGSYRDVSRVATVDEILWSELFCENRDMLACELDHLIEGLERMRRAMLENDEDTLKRLIREGRLCKLRADESTPE